MTTCARCGRCSRRGRGRFSARSIGPARSASSTSGSRARDPGRARPDAPRLGRGRVLGLLARRRRRADLLQADPGLLAGIARCLWALGALPQTLVWDRQAGMHARGGRPTEEFAAFCGQLRVGWHFCEPADPQAKGVVERLQGFVETNFEPGRAFANELDFQDQLDAWFAKRQRAHAPDAAPRPIDRLAEELEVMAPLPGRARHRPALGAARPARPAPALRHQRLLAGPGLVGRRVEVRVGEREVTAVALDTGELACRHARSFARHRTITALEHARALKRRPRGARSRGRGPAAGPLRRADRMSRPTRSSRICSAAQGAGGRAGAAQARRPRPRRGVDLRAVRRRAAQDRDRQPRQPRRPSPDQGRPVPGAQDARGVRLRLSSLAKPRTVLHLGQLDFLAGRENVVLLGPPDPGSQCLLSDSRGWPNSPASTSRTSMR